MRVRIVTAVALAASLSVVSLFAVVPWSARTVLFTALVVHISEEAYMLLRRPGSWASASAPMNVEGAADSQQPDEPGEILTFGQPERRSRLLPGSIRRPAIATVAAGIIIGGLALAVVAPAHHDAASRASATTRTQQPPAIDVLIASTVSFPVKGTPGALLQVQYLQTGHGPAAIWATLAASGLPQDTSYYTATAGDCAGGRPRILASASSLPDPHTDMLILPLNNLPASVPTEIWIKVTNAAGADLGGAHGAFLMPGAAGRAVPILPGRPVCP
jgi:hypothetical protein